MFECCAGNEEETKSYWERKELEEALLINGLGKKFIPLNGGSDTRRAIREYWQEWAEERGVSIKTTGFSVELG